MSNSIPSAPTVSAYEQASGVYQILNTVTGKRYIGSAVRFHYRWNVHRARLRKGNHHSTHLQAAWRRYGENVFRFQVLLICGKADLLFYEQLALDRYRPFDPALGYNTSPTAGSSAGVVRSAEYRARVSAAKTGHSVNAGRILSQETKDKLAAINRGKKATAETRAKMSAAQLRVPTEARKRAAASNTGQERSLAVRAKFATFAQRRTAEHLAKIGDSLRGRPLSPEHKAKLSVAHKGKRLSEETKLKLRLAQQRRRERERIERGD